MSKRNKIILTLSTAIFVVLSIVVSLVVVFAEENEIVRNVNVSCKVYNADCHVGVSYTLGNETKDFTVSGLEEDEKFLTFDKTESTQNIFQEKMLKPTNDIVLTSENDVVVFEFKLANFNFDSIDATICFVGIEELNGLEVKYSKNGINWSDNNVKIKVDGTEGIVAKEVSYFVKVSLIEGIDEFSFNQDFEIAIHS